jgi:tRNA (guanine37-N1)-methyltransferase
MCGTVTEEESGAAMRIDVVTIFPGMLDAVSGHGMTRRAIERGRLALRVWDPREFTDDGYRRVDDRPYGGGPGMVMMAEPLARALDAAREDGGGGGRVVYLSPQGRLLDQGLVAGLAGEGRLTLLAGRYEGVDERLVESRVDLEVSIGDYVLSGGELAAMVLIEAVVRLLPGVLGNEESARSDSFGAGLLDWPHYTRPETFEGRSVPAVLLSGDHERIRRWRLGQALGRTWLRRPELVERLALDPEQSELLREFQRNIDQAENAE